MRSCQFKSLSVNIRDKKLQFTVDALRCGSQPLTTLAALGPEVDCDLMWELTVVTVCKHAAPMNKSDLATLGMRGSGTTEFIS